jgi:choline-sulfatase
MDKPNILLILTDQQTASAMSCRMATGHLRTPNMDSLAERGVLFERAYSPHPLCSPARTAMMTGRYPHETGIMDLRPFGPPANRRQEKPLNHHRFPTIATLLRESGYETGYIGKWHIPLDLGKPEVSGFTFCANNGTVVMRNGRKHTSHNAVDPHNARLACQFLRRNRKSPFFLTVSFNNPHNICEWGSNQRRDCLPDGDIGAPPPSSECPPAAPNPAIPEDEADAAAGIIREEIMHIGNVRENEWKAYRWAYYRMIELVDRRLGMILKDLIETGLAENTAVVFTSDHGDCGGAHSWMHKRMLYEESVRVPLIVCPPGCQHGEVRSTLVQTGIDLLPTLADFAGISVPDDMPGHAMLSPAADQREYIAAETRIKRRATFDPEDHGLGGRMIRTQRFKYCVYDSGEHRESLFDLIADPGERINLARAQSHKEVLNNHRLLFNEYRTATRDPFPQYA